MKDSTTTNIIIAGLGGQGVLKCSDILAAVIFEAGFDVKKAEIHGMSQRGGSVTSDVRFGSNVLSPMVPPGEADYLVVLSRDQVDNNKSSLTETGVLITPDDIDESALPHPKSLNVALLGVLNRYLKIDETVWMNVIKSNLPENIHGMNEKAFLLGQGAQLISK